MMMAAFIRRKHQPASGYTQPSRKQQRRAGDRRVQPQAAADCLTSPSRGQLSEAVIIIMMMAAFIRRKHQPASGFTQPSRKQQRRAGDRRVLPQAAADCLTSSTLTPNNKSSK
jgi:ribosomal protein L32